MLAKALSVVRGAEEITSSVLGTLRNINAACTEVGEIYPKIKQGIGAVWTDCKTLGTAVGVWWDGFDPKVAFPDLVARMLISPEWVSDDFPGVVVTEGTITNAYWGSCVPPTLATAFSDITSKCNTARSLFWRSFLMLLNSRGWKYEPSNKAVIMVPVSLDDFLREFEHQNTWSAQGWYNSIGKQGASVVASITQGVEFLASSDRLGYDYSFWESNMRLFNPFIAESYISNLTSLRAVVTKLLPTGGALSLLISRLWAADGNALQWVSILKSVGLDVTAQELVALPGTGLYWDELKQEPTPIPPVPDPNPGKVDPPPTPVPPVPVPVPTPSTSGSSPLDGAVLNAASLLAVFFGSASLSLIAAGYSEADVARRYADYDFRCLAPMSEFAREGASSVGAVARFCFYVREHMATVTAGRRVQLELSNANLAAKMLADDAINYRTQAAHNLVRAASSSSSSWARLGFAIRYALGALAVDIATGEILISSSEGLNGTTHFLTGLS